MATEKQKQAIENIVENRGNVSKGMRDAGYAEKTAKNPKNLKLGWNLWKMNCPTVIYYEFTKKD